FQFPDASRSCFIQRRSRFLALFGSLKGRLKPNHGSSLSFTDSCFDTRHLTFFLAPSFFLRGFSRPKIIYFLLEHLRM
ncbi:hypothetical protein S245_016091, partial [Arachis hypogaea]